jgi:hemoglobin-like flavoprotein
MSEAVSSRTRSLIARSLPLVQQRREALVERMEIALAELDTQGSDVGQAEVTAVVLVDLLLDEAKQLLEDGAFGPLDYVSGEHYLLEITGRHYSRFGDALIPTLRDLLGPIPPREVLSAWCDTFWAIIHSAEGSRTQAVAGAPG